MRSDNLNKTMKLNRFLAQKKVIPFLLVILDLCCFFAFNYIINVCTNLMNMTQDPEHIGYYLGIGNILPHPSRYSGGIFLLYIFFILVLAVCDGIFVYQIRTSLSDKELLAGKKEGAKWTTQKEVRQQYKCIPYRDYFYPGKGGTIVQRQGENLYIDTSKSNTLVIGTTRSGKGEMYVLPSIDVYSRADKLENRPSMIISDPKMELYRSSKNTLLARGYKVQLLNLDDPMHSIGYNPLQLVIDHYKAGRIEKAQQAARSFAFAVFRADNSSQEPIWANTATDLFTALIIAITTDCLEADRQLNEKRRKLWIEKVRAFSELEEDVQAAARQKYENIRIEDMEEDLISNTRIAYIPESEDFYEVFPNEIKVSCFSCLNFFRELCDRKALERAESEDEREKLAETALDEYFNNRPPLDYAKSLYQEIKTAGDRTKGSVYINMQSALAIFSLNNIARMTAENNIDIEELGYGDKPVAIFIGLPSEDKSNHFLVTTFISQVYQFLFQLVKIKNGEKEGTLDRNVRFILDEFGNFPPIENFDGFVTVCLGLGVSFDIYVQSLNQISDKYKDGAKTILENFANQVYIMSVGKETAEEFSEILGKATKIETQRSGGRSSLDKNYTESAVIEPLLYADELTVLRPGECVVYRGIKREDRLKNPIRSYPIINEYGDWDIFGWIHVAREILKERVFGKVRMLHPDEDEDRETTFYEEWLIRKSRYIQIKGTALLYRWQYLTDTFPNPDSISLRTVNTESRKHIDYTKMIYDPEEVLKKLSRRKETEAAYCILEEMKNYYAIISLLEAADADYQEHLGISEKDTLSRVTEAVCRSSFTRQQKQELLMELNRR
ncbi:type IV secretory system conjugative DNA transfer family protein [Emergencia sp. 1XD21-10]|uniref:type IV secretory system conjugative DNA transfer family protein n=1 Tax=Emergencia sp. 1XD21-10 TaxID=2304569 RepID=UPI001379DF04|nr:type IV secretory system conjugative DNA transfer family protein [Emergencia sp. 1XD21-10]